MSRRSWGAAGVAAALAVAVILWTLFLPTSLDHLWPWSPPALNTLGGETANVVAHLIQPVVVYVALIVAAVVLARRRMRVLAATVLLGIALSVSLVTVLKHVVGRRRPDSVWLGGILDIDASYPSGHAAGATVGAILLLVIARACALPVGRLVAVGIGFVLLTWWNRLYLGVHHVSDVLGGSLAAMLGCGAAVALTGLRLRPRRSDAAPGVVWVVHHPGRIRAPALLRRLVERCARERGWPEPTWVATTVEEPGSQQVRAAIAAGATRVLVVGGDGTVRNACAAARDGQVTLGLVPAGTGDLLARQLGIPVDLPEALRVAFDGASRPVDLLGVRVDDGPETVAVVMVGAGADAAVLRDATEAAKVRFGRLAYLAAGTRHIAARPVGAVVSVDGSVEVEADVSLFEVGNVGDLHAGVSLLPGALADDGLLDVLVASPETPADVRRMMRRVLLARPDDPQVQRLRGRTVGARFASAVLCQVDGDVVGEVRALSCSVLPGAVRVARP